MHHRLCWWLGASLNRTVPVARCLSDSQTAAVLAKPTPVQQHMHDPSQQLAVPLMG
jgi:hypothetical protein